MVPVWQSTIPAVETQTPEGEKSFKKSSVILQIFFTIPGPPCSCASVGISPV